MSRHLRGKTEVVSYDRDANLLQIRRFTLLIKPPGDKPPRSLPIIQNSLAVGSDPDNDIVLDDKYVSATHARLELDDGVLTVRDLDSTNGTFIDDTKITEAPLLPGHAMRAGKTILELRAEDAHERIGPIRSDRFSGMLGKSHAMRRIFSLVEKVAPSEATVMVSGETGTGKELVARALHALSGRAEGPFLAVNCSAISRELMESELFGHERGAFTGAVQQRAGVFELADGGTLFLDEIGDLAVDLQPKLLRVLEDGTFTRVGGAESLRTDVRVVAATNRDLAQAVKEGLFRKDLFFRLKVVSIDLPPLRDRGEDLRLLTDHFVETETRKRGAGRPPELTAEALRRLEQYPWPGNVRELKNVIAGAFLAASSPDRIDAADIDLPGESLVSEGPGAMTLAQAEKEAIVRALKASGAARSRRRGSLASPPPPSTPR